MENCENLKYVNDKIYIFPLVCNNEWMLIMVSLKDQIISFYNHKRDDDKSSFVRAYINILQENCFDHIKLDIRSFPIDSVTRNLNDVDNANANNDKYCGDVVIKVFQFLIQFGTIPSNFDIDLSPTALDDFHQELLRLLNSFLSNTVSN
jgi:hypothetical protein